MRDKTSKYQKERYKLYLLAVVIVAVSALFIGMGLTPTNYQYFLYRRVPKVVAIILTGSSIAFSSIVFQTLTQNRILTPNVLGLDAVYVFIQTVVVFVFGGSLGLRAGTTGNFILTLGMMLLFSLFFYKILFGPKAQNIMLLILMGMVMGTFFGSISDAIQFLMDPNEFLNLQSAMFASFNSMQTKLILPGAILLFLAIAYVAKDIRLLDVIGLGREQAINLGVDYDKVIRKMLLVISVLVSVSTALVGPITFLGILVSNLARGMMKTYKHSYLITASMLIAVASLLVGQFLIERVLGFNVMLSMIINLVGGTYFLYLLLKEGAI
jgi:iron complex transport system permease protein